MRHAKVAVAAVVAGLVFASPAQAVGCKINTRLREQTKELTYWYASYNYDIRNAVAFVNIIDRESRFNYCARNKTSGAYGLGQSLPASKMASVGSDWLTNPITQLKWVSRYIKERYGSPRKAFQHIEKKGWY